ncbi:MAG: carboxylesterase family protein, partial [Chloroflexi bacterium]|nr:carboxylesterase family protein [Chloroflexota bacterium]
MINQQTMTTLTSVKSDIVVETQYGKVRGAAHNDLTIWKGIPYARPPAGELRFRPPQSPASWAGVRDALEFGVTAPQLPGVMGNLFGAARLPYGEDCLTLNVWSPAADDARRPVLVWIHGGSFLTGSGATPWY